MSKMRISWSVYQTDENRLTNRSDEIRRFVCPFFAWMSVSSSIGGKFVCRLSKIDQSFSGRNPSARWMSVDRSIQLCASWTSVICLSNEGILQLMNVGWLVLSILSTVCWWYIFLLMESFGWMNVGWLVHSFFYWSVSLSRECDL